MIAIMSFCVNLYGNMVLIEFICILKSFWQKFMKYTCELMKLR